MRATVQESGNFGNVDTCYESDSPYSSSGGSSGGRRTNIVLSRANFAILAGGGWTDRRPGMEVVGEGSFGFELGVTFGRDTGGVEMFIAAIRAEPSLESTEPARTVVPFGLGFGLMPGLGKVRPRLGGAFLIAGASGCDDCGIGLGGRGHLGLEVWTSRAIGIAADGIVQWMNLGAYYESDIIGDDGHELRAPLFMVRVSVLLKGSTYR